MRREHPNISIFRRLDPSNLAADPALFAPGFVWHFFNPHLPDIEGDYVGLAGLQAFFETLETLTAGTFQVEPVSVTAVGDELIVTHVKDRMRSNGQPIELDAVVVWRIVHGCIAEAWDIPSVYTEHSPIPQVA